jgi:hypothetical protein
MLKPVPAAAQDGPAARAARRQAEARADAQLAASDLQAMAKSLALEAAAMAALECAPSGIRQLAARLEREATAYANAAPTIPWR